ncbi:hypothetical protein BASA60_010987 [Batrachochytrium salamandrivorans]|nr:hypothetical protein BASA60_010987 [Batrachochytrium salamandrivorans]
MFGPALTLVLALVSSAAIASPAVNNAHKNAVASLNPSSTVLPFHFPESVYENTPYSGAASLSLSKEDEVKTATDYISNKLNLGADDFKVFNSFTDAAGVTHVYGAHMVNGARISNHQASAHVKNGEVTSFSSSFGTAQHLAKRDLAVSEAKATVDFEKASATASAQLGVPVYSKFEHVLEYVEQPDGKIVYAYKFQLRNDPATKWVQVWSDAATGKVIQAVDFANDASYKAIPFPRRDASEGFSTISDPEIKGSSPKGWTDGKATEGNNAITKDPSGKTTSSTSDGVFDTKFNGDDEPRTDDNIAASAVSLFYIANMMHDITYQYGFTEKTGNFQKDNFGKGGQGNDAVKINVLNPSRTNNANFLSPGDGQSGVMNMFRFTYTKPNRDGGFDNGIVIHEYGHGVSNRLTGGSATSGCLGTAEAGGMGEGWSDALALMILAKSSDTATTGINIGAYVRGKPEGIRSHPYTTDMKVNPLTYGDLQTRDEVHDVGEVWTSLLWEVYWNLVAKHGFSTNLNNAKQSEGNVVAMQNIIGGMMLQPCNPTFLSARDAIVAADAAHYKGANKCEILKAFAKRGLGSNATSSRKNDFSVPSECDGDAPLPRATTTATATETEAATTTIATETEAATTTGVARRTRTATARRTRTATARRTKTATTRRTRTTISREIGTTIFRRTRMTKTATAKKTKTTTTTTTTSAPEPTETSPRLDNPLDIRLHGQLVSRVESYKYLGVLIDSKLDHSAWLKQKRSALEHTISALHPVLANHQLTVNYRSRIFSAVVMGKAYYGLELVGGNKSHLASLQTTINKGIRLFTGARLSTAIGPLLVETGIGSLLTRSLVSRVRLLERSVTRKHPSMPSALAQTMMCLH